MFLFLQEREGEGRERGEWREWRERERRESGCTTAAHYKFCSWRGAQGFIYFRLMFSFQGCTEEVHQGAKTRRITRI